MSNKGAYERKKGPTVRLGAVSAAARVFDCPGCGSPTMGSWTRQGLRSALCVSCQEQSVGDVVVSLEGK